MLCLMLCSHNIWNYRGVPSWVSWRLGTPLSQMSWAKHVKLVKHAANPRKIYQLRTDMVSK